MPDQDQCLYWEKEYLSTEDLDSESSPQDVLLSVELSEFTKLLQL